MRQWIPTLAIAATAVVWLMGNEVSPLVGSGWDDLRFPATRLATGAANPPTFAQYANDGATSVGVYALRFDYQAVAGNEEQAWVTAQLPHRWREASTVDIHIHASPSNTTACNFRVCVEYLRGDAEENFEATTTAVCSTFASDQVVLKQQLEEIGELTMTGYKISAVIHGRLYRNSSHAEDTCTATNLWIHELDFHYEIDRPGGSREETAK